MSDKILRINLVETVSHDFEILVSELPDDTDLTDPNAVLVAAERKGMIDYSEGDPIGQVEVKFIEGFDDE